MTMEFLTTDVPSLFPFLEKVLQDGGKQEFAFEGEVLTYFQREGLTGFEYRAEDLKGLLTVGIILGNTGFVLKRVLTTPEAHFERYDHYNIKGEFSYTSYVETLSALFVDNTEMEVTCPILNHLYNFLAMEYKLAASGKSSTHMVHSIENFLAMVYRSNRVKLPIKGRTGDPIVTAYYNKILETELDPVLTWTERQQVFAHYKEELYKVLDVKIRAHKLSPTRFKMAMAGKSLSSFADRLLARPVNNSQGLLYRYTIGKVIWFFQTVKNNLGYSVALAVYGPFTYYFITMPMNPHAMQAVGKVRSTYLQVKYQMDNLMDKGSVVINDMSSKNAIADAPANQSKILNDNAPEQNQVMNAVATPAADTVSTKAAAPAKSASVADVNAQILANIIYASEVTLAPSKPLVVQLGGGNKIEAKASVMNMLLGTDVEQVNRQNWVERMSNFKQMQIAYEENIEFASRMGRLEQLETQYNFPMQVESTWEELERYNSMIFKLREENPNMSAKMKQFLFNEINRTQQLELYLWDRMSRHILDQIYVMLDQDKEQKRNDYYVGRAFVFMQEMTNVLSWRYKDFKKPEGYERIQKLADFYSKNRKENNSIMKNLQANSDLFKQKSMYDTKEFRSYMKRQWEILFLQNAKAEEAANMGLNMYIWSVRNTVWILQTIYSAKREELAMLIKRDSTGTLFSPGEMLARSRISLMYETLFHNLTLEYVGIREEIMNRLGKDIESTQRMMVLDNLKEFFSDREKLDGVSIADSSKTPEKTVGTSL